MNNYEKRIGLKSIYLTFVRHFIEMLIIFVPIAIVSVVVIKGFIKPTYSSSVTFSKSTTFTTAHYENLTKTIKSDAVMNKVVESLGDLKHSNGKAITAGEITSAIAGPSSYTNNASSNIKYTITMSEKKLVQPIMEKVAEYTKAALVEDKDWTTLDASSATSAATNDSSKKYLLIALAVDLVLSLGVPFIFEIVGDQVYDKDDISYLGCSGFEISASKVSK